MKLSNAEHKQLLRSKYVYSSPKEGEVYIYVTVHCCLEKNTFHFLNFALRRCARAVPALRANARELETKNERGGRYYCTVVRLYIGRQLYMNSQGIV